MKSEDKLFIVGVSGGADSLALLDILWRRKSKLLAVHINYHSRENSNEDEKLVRMFCKKREIKLLINDYNPKIYQLTNRNREQLWRDIRLRTLTTIANELIRIEARQKRIKILLGHNLNDNLETYLMQKQRNILPEVYGLPKKTTIKKIQLLRPLLDWTKEKIINYCHRKKIKFATDHTNSEPIYFRNRIRIQLNNLDKRITEIILLMMRIDNNALKIKRFLAKNFILSSYKKNSDRQPLHYIFVLNSPLVQINSPNILKIILYEMTQKLKKLKIIPEKSRINREIIRQLNTKRTVKLKLSKKYFLENKSSRMIIKEKENYY